jgi:tetratricopeptide (TPR) repeat protein
MLRAQTSILYAALVIATFAVYLPVCKNDFVDFDDEMHIVKNPQVTRGLSWSGVCWAWTTCHGNYWQPITWLSLQADADFFSGRPAGAEPVLSPAAFHLHSLFWHAASVLLLFALWQRLTGTRWRSFLVAALFALHPMHVESVAWAVERKDVLCAFFGLLTVWTYLRYLEMPGLKRYFLVVAAFATCLMCKPMLMTLPCVLLLLDYWPLGRFGSSTDAAKARNVPLQPAPLGRLILEKLPLFLMTAGIAVVTLIGREQAGALVPLSQISVSARLANALSSYGQYLASTFWPVNLAVLYPHPGDNWSIYPALAGATALAAITLIAAWQGRRLGALITGWLWFVGTLLPVIGLAQGGAQAWADRFSYFPHIGLFVALVWGLGELFIRLRVPARASAALATLGLGALAALTWVQVGYWRDTATLWERALAVNGDRDHAHAHLGKYYFDHGRLDLAESHFAKAAQAVPDSLDYHFFFGEVLLSLGKLDEAAVQFRETLSRKPDYSDAWYSLGVSELRRLKLETAVRCFRKTLELQPDSPDALTGMGLALLQEGERAEAVRCFHHALRKNSRDAQALSGLGYARLAHGQADDAIECFTEAVRFNPGLVKARSGLGVAFGRRGDWDRALECHRLALQLAEQGEQLLKSMGGTVPDQDLVTYRCRLALGLHQADYSQAAADEYRVACKRDPDWPDRFTAEAWKLATHADSKRRDPRLALELASQAVQAVAEPSAATLTALAAAYAATGDFRAAVQIAQEALAKTSPSRNPGLADAIRRHLSLYRNGVPFTNPEASEQ